MKIIIDMPDLTYESIMKSKVLKDVGADFIRNGKPLPDNASNGDVIKAIFPNLEQDKERLIQQYGSQSLYDTYEKWCSLPYKER